MPPRQAASTTKRFQAQGAGSKTRPKKTPKQPLPVSERLKRLFTSLCAQIDGGHLTNAVKTCDKILRLEPNDKDALQTKLFLLLQTEQYTAALTLIDQGNEFLYEKAYALYRSNRESEAREAVDELKKVQNEDDRGILHLEAQLCYREGSYDLAVELYNQLLDTSEPHTDEHADIATNLEAAQKHLDFINAGYLRALDALPSSVVNTIESAPPPQPASALSATLAAAASQSAPVPASKEKKVRTKRIPKGVVLGVTPMPDPERWLKKSERSTYNQGKRRKAGGGGATQGAVDSGPVGAVAGHGGKTGGKGKKKK